MNQENYSVLMSVYAKEKPEYLRLSIESMFSQTVVTDDFILVCDGPLTEGLDQVVAEYENRYPERFHVVRFPVNRGTGPAVRDGLLHCKNDLVARMDSDDISLPSRCQTQLRLFAARPELQLCSGAIAEFIGTPANICSVRSLPRDEKIASYAKMRNPFNQVAVMFRKSAVLAAGNYRDMPLFEDYDLWLRMLRTGCRACNIPDVLCLVRVDNMYERRGGVDYLKKTVSFRTLMLKDGFCNVFQYLAALLACAVVYLVPKEIRQWFYMSLLRSGSVERYRPAEEGARKFLIVAHYSRFLVHFELNNVRILQEMGYEVHYATNYLNEDMHQHASQIIREHGVHLHQIDFTRSPFNLFSAVKAYRQLRDLMLREKFSGMHCHTPTAGVLARVAARSAGVWPVLYTAHGFHFFKGCPMWNRVIYKPAEHFLARWTDYLLTINEEDYRAAQNFHVRSKVYRVNGVGVDLKKPRAGTDSREALRRELGIPGDAYVLLSVGEVNRNKNQASVLRALAKTGDRRIWYVICGKGVSLEEDKALARKLKLEDRVLFVGYREDIEQFYAMADLFVFPSFREGLPVALMEAMAAGLPCVASRIRGNVDLLPESGLLFEPGDTEALSRLVLRCMGENLREEIERNARHLESFSLEAVGAQMEKIYAEALG